MSVDTADDINLDFAYASVLLKDKLIKEFKEARVLLDDLKAASSLVGKMQITIPIKYSDNDKTSIITCMAKYKINNVEDINDIIKFAEDRGLLPEQVINILDHKFPSGRVPNASDFVTLTDSIKQDFIRQQNINLSLQGSGLSPEDIKAASNFIMHDSKLTPSVAKVIVAIKDQKIKDMNNGVSQPVDVSMAMTMLARSQMEYQSIYPLALAVASSLRQTLGYSAQQSNIIASVATDILQHESLSEEKFKNIKRPDLKEIVESINALRIDKLEHDPAAREIQANRVLNQVLVNRQKNNAEILPVTGPSDQAPIVVKMNL